MPEHPLMKRVSSADPRVRVDLPEVKVALPEPRELAQAAAQLLEKRIRDRLGSVPSKWTGLARWLQDSLRVTNGGLEWPHSSAVERMGAMDIDPRWLDEALEQALKDAIV